jgi:enoyl-CoA hydratase/carnithine racemase
VEYETILWSVDEHIATITLNRPEVMNALNRRAYAELQDAVERAGRESDVRVVLITGAGRAFCSGDDVRQLMLDEGEQQRRKQAPPARPVITPAAEAILRLSKPTIALINGAAVGWGCDLALLCDFRIAARNARIGEIFVKRGLIADVGGSYRLPQIVGLTKALELLFTGDIIGADEAQRIGLVGSVVEPEDLLAAGHAFAARIAANPPLAVQYVKEAVRTGLQPPLEAIAAFTARAYQVLFATEDHAEGARAFIEKREPHFSGR